MSDLEAIFRAIVIRSQHEYELGGVSFRVPAYSPAPFGGQFSPFAAGVPPLVGDLQQRIYEHAYVRPLNGRIDDAPPPPSMASLADALSAANATRERWDAGWRIVQLAPNGHIWARKGAAVQSFAPGRYATVQGAPPLVGAPANVYLAKESRDLQPGFYHVFGELPLDDRNDGRLTRIYFHIDEAGAPLLVNAVTSSLNRFLVPFRMKTLAYRGIYTRADAAVLFFAKRSFPIIARLLARIRGSVRDHLGARTPLMTKRLFDGIGLAEDPANGDSFGTSRCRLIAQAIWDAYTRGQQSEAARTQELDLQFARNGLVLALPYLRAASADVYEIPREDAG